MSKLRTYAPLSRTSDKVKAAEGEYKAVYKVVDARSEGRCEYFGSIFLTFVENILQSSDRREHFIRCTRRATDHHHLYKPRRSNHEPELIVHLCRHHHDRCEWPYKRGRLVIALVGGRHVFRIRFASDKFAARAEA